MFIIDKAYRIGPRGDDKMVVDYDRDVWMQRVTTIPNLDEGYGTEVFSLVWKGRHLHFEAHVTQGEREDLVGRLYNEWQITSLGGGRDYYYMTSIKPEWADYTSDRGDQRKTMEFYTPPSDEEYLAFVMLALEALITFGGFYDGKKIEEEEGWMYCASYHGPHKLPIQGQVFCKNDFVHAKSA